MTNKQEPSICPKISSKAVYEYLENKGIESTRLGYEEKKEE